MKPELQSKVVCPFIDRWSNVHNEPIVCVCVTSNHGNTYLVDTIDTAGHPHTGDYLRKIVHDSIEKIQNLYECKLGSLVTDNAANIVVMRNHIAGATDKVITYGCAAHHLNLLAKDFDNPAETEKRGMRR